MYHGLRSQRSTDGLQLLLGGRCIHCRKDQPLVTVTATAFDHWQSGTLIQDAFPHLTDWQREFLISGMCPGCWDEMCRIHDERETPVPTDAPMDWPEVKPVVDPEEEAAQEDADDVTIVHVRLQTDKEHKAVDILQFLSTFELDELSTKSLQDHLEHEGPQSDP